MTNNTNNIAIAEAYYRAMGEKNIEGIDKHLHSDVLFVGPLAEIRGKIGVLESAKAILNFFKTLTIRATFGSEDQVMIAYDLDCPAPIEKFRVAALLTFKEDLITKIELFYDASPFQRKDEEILRES